MSPNVGVLDPEWYKYSNEPYDIVIRIILRIIWLSNEQRRTTFPTAGYHPGRVA